MLSVEIVNFELKELDQQVGEYSRVQRAESLRK